MSGNMIPDDDNYGKKAESIFNQGGRGMEFAGGMKMLRALVDGHQTKQSIEQRNNLEQTARNRQALNVTVKTATWTDGGGRLWTVPNKYHVKIPVDLVDDDCRLDEVEFELTPDSRSATLVLTSEDAFGGGGAENVLGSAGSKGSVLYDQPIGPAPPTQPTGPETPAPSAPPEEAPQRTPEQVTEESRQRRIDAAHRATRPWWSR